MRGGRPAVFVLASLIDDRVIEPTDVRKHDRSEAGFVLSAGGTSGPAGTMNPVPAGRDENFFPAPAPNW